jgi:hypothetical protein
MLSFISFSSLFLTVNSLEPIAHIVNHLCERRTLEKEVALFRTVH